MTKDPQRTTPIGLARYAKDFFDTAMAADETLGTQPGYEIIAPVPVMYLVGHSIELSLKAFLVSEGISLDELASRKYGHDLNVCFAKANELGLSKIIQFEKIEVDGMRDLNTLHSTKQLSYIVTGAKKFPIFGPIQSFAQQLLSAVGGHVGYR